MLRYGLSSDGKTFTAERFDGFGVREAVGVATEDQRIGVICDVETTGLSPSAEQVIEVAARKIVFNRTSGEIVAVGPAFEALQQPTKPLPPFITKLTGLTDAALEGHAISWSEFDSFIADAAVIIAHNAAFDRPFIEKQSTVSTGKIWGCSAFHLDWRATFPSGSLPLLALFHGFFYEAHRALIDVDALIRLLGLPMSEGESRTYLYRLLQNAKTPACRVIALNAKFESRGVLKRRRYTWNRRERLWSKLVRGDKRGEEEAFLAAEVYDGQGFLGRTEELPLRENFRRGW